MLSNLAKVTQLASGGEKLNIMQIGSKYFVQLESQCCSSCRPELLNPQSTKSIQEAHNLLKLYIKLQ